MASHYSRDEEDQGPYRGYRPSEFNTMNIAAPVRLGVPAHAPSLDFDSAPIKIPPVDGEAKGAGYAPSQTLPSYTPSGGETPINAPRKPSSGGSMHAGLVIANVVLRSLALLSLIVALAVLASATQTIDGVTLDYSSSTSTKYALAAAIIGAAYSIYQTVFAAIRLATGRLVLITGQTSLLVSYIGDQVVVCLILTGGTAAAAVYKDLSDLTVCDQYDVLCKQGAGAASMIFVGFAFLAASSVISSFCFYKKRT